MRRSARRPQRRPPARPAGKGRRGEAYLAAGQPDRAEYHLRELARICDSACEEFVDLRAAISQYRAQPATARLQP